MMKIAVISDTHNRLPSHLLPKLTAADEIWHLGDVTDESCLDPLLALGKRLLIIRGNCDSNYNWPLTLDLQREGFRIHLVHIPPRKAPEGVDLLFHGHTHVPRNEKVGDTRFLNPGTVGKPNKGVPGSFAWLKLEAGKPIRWEVEWL